MTTKHYQWLPHLENSIPKEAQGYTVSMYSVALEGWRRGLTLKFINKNRSKALTVFSLSKDNTERIFIGSHGSKTTRKAVNICKDKHLTKKFLIEAGVPTPEGDLFKQESSNEEIIKYANKLGYPIVIKPVSGKGGNGVIANIQNKRELKDALTYVRNELNMKDVIVEKHYDGKGYRIYVIGDKVIGAFDRIPANVIGDGKHNIKTLLKKKIEERNLNPALFNRPIKIDKEMHNMLESKGYDLNSIPSKGERVILKTKNNVSSGGDSIDVTDELTEEIKAIAINAVRAIPGLGHAGVDVIFNEKENTSVVLEINSRPSIRNHLFPNEGKARDIPKAIIDYYFPETKSIETLKFPLYYFDFQHVFDNFKKGNAKEITIPDIPKGELTAVRFEVSGTLHGVNFGGWIRRQTRALELNGFIKFVGPGNAEIVVSGSKDSVDKFENLIRDNSSKRAKIEQIKKEDYNKPIKIGFEIIRSKEKLKDGYYPVHLKDEGKRRMKKSLKRSESSTLRKERDFYKKRYEEMRNSTSWRVTKPLRVIGSVKKLLRK